MKLEELFEATAPVDQEKIDKKFMSFLRNDLIRVTKKSMADGDVRYWMHSKQKMIIESDRSQRKTITDKTAAEFGLKDLEGVKDFFKRYGVNETKKPREPRVGGGSIWD